MADAMVTARMPKEKKEAGNRILEQMGTNASQVVNRLYDYVLEKKELPFEEKKTHTYTKEEIAQAAAFVDSLSTKRTAGIFESMTAKDAKRIRLAKKGLL